MDYDRDKDEVTIRLPDTQPIRMNARDFLDFVETAKLTAQAIEVSDRRRS